MHGYKTDRSQNINIMKSRGDWSRYLYVIKKINKLIIDSLKPKKNVVPLTKEAYRLGITRNGTSWKQQSIYNKYSESCTSNDTHRILSFIIYLLS